MNAASSRRMAETTHRLAEGIVNARRMQPRQRDSFLSNRDRLMEQNWRNGRYSVIDHVDFDQLQADALGRDTLRALHAQESRYQDARIQEQVMDAITRDNYMNLLTTQIRFGVIERTEHAATGLMAMVDTNIRLGPFTTKLPRERPIADVTGDCSGELEETQFFGTPPLPLIDVPEACKIKFAFAYTREMADVDNAGAGGRIRQYIDRQGDALLLHGEKLLVDLMYGLYDTAAVTNNPFPFIEDGVTYHTYYAVGGAGPWENDVTSNVLDGTFQPYETLERIFEDRRDPYSGEPITRNGEDRIVCTNSIQQRLAAQGLGTFLVEQDLPGGSNNERLRFNRSGGYSVSAANIVFSRYIFDRLSAWYQTTAGGSLNATQAAAAAESTWLFGNTSGAFGWGTEWDPEELEMSGNQTWQYLNQEVLAVKKWMEKTTPVAKDPQLVYRCRS